MTLRVKAIPRSARTEIAGKVADGTLKVKIAGEDCCAAGKGPG